ncbi:MAG: hypothetical protein ACREE7_19765 [Dongiaceae bacterium]
MSPVVRRLIAALLPPLLLAGCLPESQNPIAPPEAAIIDPQLPGLWMTQVEDEQLYLHVLKGDGHLYDVVSVSHRPDGRGATDLYEGYVTPVGDLRFANLQPIDSLDDDSGDIQATYFFTAYEFEGPDRLVVRFLAQQPLIDAIAAGKLKGEVSTANKLQALGLDVLLTEEPARLAEFLATTDPAVLFDRSMTFRRVPPLP